MASSALRHLGASVRTSNVGNHEATEDGMGQHRTHTPRHPGSGFLAGLQCDHGRHEVGQLTRACSAPPEVWRLREMDDSSDTSGSPSGHARHSRQNSTTMDGLQESFQTFDSSIARASQQGLLRRSGDGGGQPSPVQRRLFVRSGLDWAKTAGPATASSSSSAIAIPRVVDWQPPVPRRSRSAIQIRGLERRAPSQERPSSPAIGFMSQQYCWRRTEKRVEAAFDIATDGSGVLRYPQLGHFLAEMGCVSHAAGKDNGLTSRDGTSQFCAAVWRHLDPYNEGCVDLLTLVVFFHMLMGTTTAGVNEALPSKGRRSGHQTPRLEADPHEVSRGSGLEMLVSPDSLATGQGVDRLDELLQRFDPACLRAEFKDIYRHRLYHEKIGATRPCGSRQGRSPEVPLVPCVYAVRRHKGTKDSTRRCRRVEDQLLLWAKQVEAKQLEQRRLAREAEGRQCTFRPQVASSEGEHDSQHPPVHQALYDKGLALRRQRAEEEELAEEAKSLAEEKGCTFKPDIRCSQQSLRRAVDNTSQYPRGYEATTARTHRTRGYHERYKRTDQSRHAGQMKETHVMQAPTVPHAAAIDGAKPRGGAACYGAAQADSTPKAAYTPPRPLESEPVVRSAMPDAGCNTGQESTRWSAQREIYFNVQVRLQADADPVTLSFYHGDSPSEVAAEFGAAHGLPPQQAQLVYHVLREQMQALSSMGTSAL